MADKMDAVTALAETLESVFPISMRRPPTRSDLDGMLAGLKLRGYHLTPIAPPQGELAREEVARWMIQNSYATGHGDTLADLLAELVAQAKGRATAAQGPRDWQSIETAPKDRTRVFLWLPEIADVQRAGRIESYWTIWWENEYGNGPAYASRGHLIQPSHWMPLPVPPTPEPGSE